LGVSPEAMIVRMPVLLLLGEKDVFILPETAQGLEEYAPSATVKVVPGGGHFLTLESPDLVSSEVRGFFAAGRG
jgi:epoxide hydrolase 4